MTLQYRPEIDGLRAVAVLPVILFHAGLEQVSGGYVGVDVFFVISGFLITGILAREMQSGTFSLVGFYERRARRILPALFAMLTVSAVVAVLILLPYELAQFGRGLVAVLLFGSNILFWRESGYFAPASEENPLLHTWSLAVEEQYYILFPLVLWALWRAGMRPVMIILGALALGSLVLAEVLSTRMMPSANFYLLPTRAWELLAGSLAALYLINSPPPKGWLAEMLGIVGLGAIMFSILTYDASTPFPSLWALAPVLGTVAIILAASPATLVGRLLCLAPCVGIGLISYSAYLWHQPLFAFARVLAPSGHPPQVTMMGLAALSLVLGWLSWRFVERPFRQKDRISRRGIFLGTGTGAVVLGTLGAVAIVLQGLPQRYPEGQRPWISTGPLEYAGYVAGLYRTVRNAPLSDGGSNLVIVGDSFSQDFFNVINERGAFADHKVSAVYVLARCQIHYGFSWEEITPHIAPQDRELCRKRVLNDKHLARIRNSDVVVFVARWQPWAAERFARSLEAMQIPDNVQVIVIGSKSFEKNRRAFLALDPADPTQTVRAPEPWVQESTRILKASLPPGVFVDTQALLCSGGCPLINRDGALVSYDGLHLTREGAALVGEHLFAAKPLDRFDGQKGQSE